jgi:hypothetical protein
MGSKGKLVMDESSYEGELGGVVRNSKFETIHLPPGDKGLSDKDMLKKHAQGRWPVVTRDKTMYKENPTDGGATGFVVVPNLAPEQLEDYKVVLGGFLSKHTSKTLSGKQWEVSGKNDITITDLSNK